MDVSAIPQPRVQLPTISAPRAARDARSLIKPPIPPAAPDPWAFEAMDRAIDIAPSFAEDTLFRVVRGVNNLVFRGDGKAGTAVPATPDSWKFAAIGDYGSGRKALADVSGNVAKGNPDLIVTTGDNVYYSGTEEEYARKWDPPNMFGSLRENFPVLPSLGNHDTRKSSAPYFRRFPELDKARFYSYDHKGVHFVALNTNESLAPGSPQLRWLDEDLAKSGADWKVLYLHHPLNGGYPQQDDGPNKGYLAPLMAKHGVDLVLSGHAHNYMRSKPLNENGTLEILTGGGGQSLHPFLSKQPDFIQYRDVDFGHLEVEVTDKQLVGRYVVRDGSVRDTFVLDNRTPGAPAADAEAAGLLAEG